MRIDECLFCKQRLVEVERKGDFMIVTILKNDKKVGYATCNSTYEVAEHLFESLLETNYAAQMRWDGRPGEPEPKDPAESISIRLFDRGTDGFYGPEFREEVRVVAGAV